MSPFYKKSLGPHSQCQDIKLQAHFHRKWARSINIRRTVSSRRFVDIKKIALAIVLFLNFIPTYTYSENDPFPDLLARHFFKMACQYSLDWWKPFPKEEAPSWEILPQEATYGIDVILSKRTELEIFSNFAKTPFLLDGKTYASIEGFWQMMKYPDPDDPNDPRHRKELVWKYTREGVSQLSGFDAKHAGDATKENYEKLGIKWISYFGKRIEYKGKDQEEHYRLIFRATQAKIDQNPKAKGLLTKTVGLVLRPDHQQSADATPAYRYHEILMRIR